MSGYFIHPDLVRDPLWKAILARDTSIIPRLIPVLDDTQKSPYYDTNRDRFFTYGQLTFLVIDHIEKIPWLLPAQHYQCVGDLYGNFDMDFIDSLQTIGHKFKRVYSEYFSSIRRTWFRDEATGIVSWIHLDQGFTSIKLEGSIKIHYAYTPPEARDFFKQIQKGDSLIKHPFIEEMVRIPRKDFGKLDYSDIEE